MTWYAQHIFAEPRREVLNAFHAIPRLRNSIFHVPHLRDFETERQSVGAVFFTDDGPKEHLRTVREGPKLPADGLVVIRELIASHDDSCKEWFGEDAVRWDDLGNELPRSADPVLQYAKVFEGAPDGWETVAPPVNSLNLLKSIAESTQSVVAYYACHIWGGDVECVFGWVWDGQRQTSAFYRAVVATDAQGQEKTGFYTDLTGAYEVTRFGRRLIVEGDVLTLVLLPFGVLLRGGYFEPHRRSFPWEEYRWYPGLPRTDEPLGED